jgi:uncharacterized protein
VKFAINYSPAALHLKNQNRLAVDLFKCPDWLDYWQEFAHAAPVYIHFQHVVGAGRMESVNWDQTEFLRAQSATPCVNLHLSLYRTGESASWPMECEEPAGEKMLQLVRDEIALAANRYGAENIIVENVPYQDAIGRQARMAVDPEFLSRLVAETGCGFLLDLAHARITAGQLGIPEQEYIEALPLHRLREMHITGLSEVDGLRIDHGPMTEEDWPSAEWAMQNIRAGKWSEPWVMTFEYGGIGPRYAHRTDATIIETQMARFIRMWREIESK